MTPDMTVTEPINLQNQPPMHCTHCGKPNQMLDSGGRWWL